MSQDGIQRPPLRFPRGGHLLQFLSCLENGLLPHGQLDPPLWSQRGKVGTPKLGSFLSPQHCRLLLVWPPCVVRHGAACEELVLFTQGKVFPKLRKRSPQGSSESASDKEDDEATDYVFRIIYPGTQSEFGECIGRECLGGCDGGVSSRGHSPDTHEAIHAGKWFQGRYSAAVTVLPLICHCIRVGGLFFLLTFHLPLSPSFLQLHNRPRLPQWLQKNFLPIISVVRFFLVGSLGATVEHHSPPGLTLLLLSPDQRGHCCITSSLVPPTLLLQRNREVSTRCSGTHLALLPGCRGEGQGAAGVTKPENSLRVWQ